MGYFDGITDASFKKDTQGNTVFYPNGILGKGYVIPSEERAVETRRYIKKMYMVVVPAAVIPAVIAGSSGHLLASLLVGLPISAIFLAWYYGFAVRKLTKGLDVSQEKLTHAEAMENSVKSHSFATLIFFEVISILFMAGGLFMTIVGNEVLPGVILTLLFGLGSGAFAVMIYKKRKASP